MTQNHTNEHREDSTEVLRYTLQHRGELVLSGIGPDVAARELKRVKRIVSQIPGLRKQLTVWYNPEARIIYAVKEDTR